MNSLNDSFRAASTSRGKQRESRSECFDERWWVERCCKEEEKLDECRSAILLREKGIERSKVSSGGICKVVSRQDETWLNDVTERWLVGAFFSPLLDGKKCHQLACLALPSLGLLLWVLVIRVFLVWEGENQKIIQN